MGYFYISLKFEYTFAFRIKFWVIFDKFLKFISLSPKITKYFFVVHLSLVQQVNLVLRSWATYFQPSGIVSLSLIWRFSTDLYIIWSWRFISMKRTKSYVPNGMKLPTILHVQPTLQINLQIKISVDFEQKKISVGNYFYLFFNHVSFLRDVGRYVHLGGLFI